MNGNAKWQALADTEPTRAELRAAAVAKNNHALASRNKCTAEQRDAMVALVDAGETISSVARLVGISQSTLSRIVSRRRARERGAR